MLSPPPPVPPVRTVPTRSPTRFSSWPASGPGNAEPAAPLPPLPSPARSAASVVFVTAQPLFRPPIMFQSGTRAPSMKTSLNIARPVISRSGRTSTPGWSISNAKYEMPVCFGAFGSVRAISIPRLQICAVDVHTFWPVMTHSSPSRSALHCSPARSEPAPGSLNSWHHAS